MTAKRQPQSRAYAPMETMEDAAVPKYLIFVSASSRILSLAAHMTPAKTRTPSGPRPRFSRCSQEGFGGGAGGAGGSRRGSSGTSP